MLAASHVLGPRGGIAMPIFLLLTQWHGMQIGALAKEGALVEIEVVADA